MKKILLLFVLIISFKLNAQISIYREDFGLPNEWYLIATDNQVDPDELATLLPNGANANWDATGIRPQFQDTFFYLSPADFPGAPEGCNLLFINPVLSSLPDFYQAGIARISQLIQPDGFFGAQGKVAYLNFPSTYGNVFRDSIETVFTTLAVDIGVPENPLFDSAQIIYRYSNHSEFIGYGELRTKFNNLPINALKRKLVKTQRTFFKVRNKVSGAYVDIPGGFDPGGVNTSKTSYQWFTTNGGVPILEFDMDTINKARNLKYLVNSLRLMNTGINENEFLKLVKVYPNPGQEFFEISLPVQNKIDQISIYNSNGVLVKELNDVMPESKILHGIENSGLYLIQIKMNNSVHTTKWLKQ